MYGGNRFLSMVRFINGAGGDLQLVVLLTLLC